MENETVDPITEDPTGTGTTETGTTTTEVDPVEPTSVIITDPTTGEPVEGITEEEWDLLQSTLEQIQTNTVPYVPDPSAPPTGMTYEQAQIMIDTMGNLDQALYILIVIAGAFFFWQICKVLYQYIAGVIFG